MTHGYPCFGLIAGHDPSDAETRTSCRSNGLAWLASDAISNRMTKPESVGTADSGGILAELGHLK